MTRTARAAYPRAIIKDRSNSRAGVETAIRKNGAGQHNWGSLYDERQLEDEAMADQGHEVVDTLFETTNNLADTGMTAPPPSSNVAPGLPSPNNNNTSENDLEDARKFRKNALKTNNINLSTIARTSVAVIGSPLREDGTSRRFGHNDI